LALLFAMRRSALRRVVESASVRMSRLFGGIRAGRDESAANFAQLMATLLDAGVSQAEALRIAADVWRDRSVTLAEAAVHEPVSQRPRQGTWQERMPAFLRWALADSRPAASTSLATAAQVYRASAQRRRDRVRAILPIVICVVIGGGVTLLYGLALFLPVVDMLRGIAAPLSPSTTW
jgi:type II secretory pathway component PulF